VVNRDFFNKKFSNFDIKKFGKFPPPKKKKKESRIYKLEKTEFSKTFPKFLVEETTKYFSRENKKNL